MSEQSEANEGTSVRTLGIVGLGLIGGSIGLGASSAGIEVIGVDADDSVGKKAVERGAVSRQGTLAEVAAAEVVVLAVPPKALANVIEKVAPLLGPSSVLTDVGGVKGALVEAYRSIPMPSQAVPGHPMAGLERGGIENANGDLFRGARWILCPIPETGKESIGTMRRLVQTLGAEPLEMSAEVHDREIAVMSHLPHALAAGLMELASKLEHPRASAGSWKDVTRVAGVDPELWTEIFMMNRQELSRAISSLDHRLTELRRALVAADEGAVRQFMQQAREVKLAMREGQDA